MKTYRGFRDSLGIAHVTVDGREISARLDLWNHSPTGREWGYFGSGPAQTALAILADYLDNEHAEAAVRMHQRFKFDVIGKLPRLGWTLTASDVAAWFQSQIREARDG